MIVLSSIPRALVLVAIDIINRADSEVQTLCTPVGCSVVHSERVSIVADEGEQRSVADAGDSRIKLKRGQHRVIDAISFYLCRCLLHLLCSPKPSHPSFGAGGLKQDIRKSGKT
jgi:hypothetical protein